MTRASTIVAILLLAAGCSHHAEPAGPAGLPYRCADGRLVRISFGGGDPNRMPARLDIGGHDHVLAPAQPMSGLRYRAGDIVWEAEGDEATVTEAGRATRCTRIREGEAAAPAHGDDH